MDLWLLIKSISIGVAVAAPIGPMSLLCMRHTIQFGQVCALVFGCGIAAADATYAAIAAFGITVVSAVLLIAALPIQAIGSFILIFFGLRIVFSKPRHASAVLIESFLMRAFFTAYGLTITNPPTILFFASVFASVSVLSSFIQSAVFSFGVFLGSMVWWMLLTSLVARFAVLFTEKIMQFINRLSGLVLVGLGLYGLIRLFNF